MPVKQALHPAQIHCPVLPEETIRLLAPRDGGIYVDATLGLGGHTEQILARSGPTGRVIAFDWDLRALELARDRLTPFRDRVTFVHRSYAEIEPGLAAAGVGKVDGILVDLGLSSLQLDSSVEDVGRGFSFQGKEPLDMRMDQREAQTAAALINNATEQELADIFYYYGEEKQARRIAAQLVKAREKNRFETTDQLADLVARAIPRRFHPRKIHVATRVFQAVRIAVNRELENLDTLLKKAPALLNPGARLCIISFHSLEDRLVKWGFRNNPCWQIITRKPVRPGRDEARANPRARSARLRAAALQPRRDEP